MTYSCNDLQLYTRLYAKRAMILMRVRKIAKSDLFRHVRLSRRPSARTHGTTRLPLHGFSRNLICEFSKICPQNSSFIDIWQE